MHTFIGIMLHNARASSCLIRGEAYKFTSTKIKKLKENNKEEKGE